MCCAYCAYFAHILRIFEIFGRLHIFAFICAYCGPPEFFAHIFLRRGNFFEWYGKFVNFFEFYVRVKNSQRNFLSKNLKGMHKILLMMWRFQKYGFCWDLGQVSHILVQKIWVRELSAYLAHILAHICAYLAHI